MGDELNKQAVKVRCPRTRCPSSRWNPCAQAKSARTGLYCTARRTLPKQTPVTRASTSTMRSAHQTKTTIELPLVWCPRAKLFAASSFQRSAPWRMVVPSGSNGGRFEAGRNLRAWRMSANGHHNNVGRLELDMRHALSA